MTMTNFLVTGVGGQGTLLAADIIAQVGLAQGLDAKKSEVHGMAQRGGVVVSHVRWGERVYAPLIALGEADFLIGQEIVEGGRFLPYLKPGGVLLLSSETLPPPSLTLSKMEYPPAQKVLDAAREITDRIVFIAAPKLAEELGNRRVANTILLGALSAQMPEVDPAFWLDVIVRRVPQKAVEVNRKAFELGRKMGREIATSP